MKKVLTITQHSIEEFLNDNPLSTNPKKKLKRLYVRILSRMQSHRDVLIINNIDGTQKLILKNDVLVVSKNRTIITYFNWLSKETYKFKKDTTRNIKRIIGEN